MSEKFYKITVTKVEGEEANQVMDVECHDYLAVISDIRLPGAKDFSLGVSVKTSTKSIPRAMGWAQWLTNWLIFHQTKHLVGMKDTSKSDYDVKIKSISNGWIVRELDYNDEDKPVVHETGFTYDEAADDDEEAKVFEQMLWHIINRFKPYSKYSHHNVVVNIEKGSKINDDEEGKNPGD